MRKREAEAFALTADRTKAMGVALAGLADDAEVDLAALEMPTRAAAMVLGFHPEHVRRLIRNGYGSARHVGSNYRVWSTTLAAPRGSPRGGTPAAYAAATDLTGSIASTARSCRGSGHADCIGVP